MTLKQLRDKLNLIPEEYFTEEDDPCQNYVVLDVTVKADNFGIIQLNAVECDVAFCSGIGEPKPVFFHIVGSERLRHDD